MTKKVRCVLYDFIPKSSFLSEQLKIKSLSQLFLFDHYYFDNPAKWMMSDDWGYDVEFKKVSKSLRAEEVDLYRPEAGEVILLWPMNRWPKNINSLSSIIKNLINNGSGVLSLDEDRAFLFDQKKKFDEALATVETFDFTAEPEKVNIAILASPCRSFNHLQADKNFIVKTSEDVKKARLEAKFLSLVPPEAKKYYPEVLGVFETDKEFSYKIPRYNRFDFSRLILHGNLSDKECGSFFDGLERYFKSIPRIEVPLLERANAVRALYVDKLNTRMEAYREGPHFFRAQELTSELINVIENEISEISQEDLYFSHGDLCFSNILLERAEMSDLKLVDPRGANSIREAFLPLEYDLSKISQCIFGNYDLILARRMADTSLGGIYRRLQTEFERLMDILRVDKKLIFLGEASLFLSMLPLHMEHTDLHIHMIEAANRAIARYRKYSYGS